MNEYFFIDEKSIRYCYPYECDKRTTSYGVLDQYVGNKYTREEMDKIIAEMMIRHPYVAGSMRLNLSIMRFHKGLSFYHSLSFRNYSYLNQEVGNPEIEYEKK